MATARSDIIIATAAAHLLEHPVKQPLLHVVYAGADEPHTDQGLESRLVGALVEAARALGISGVWLCEDVAAIVRAADG